MIGFIIAGGRSSRMGGTHKCLLELNGVTILERIKTRTQDQLSELVLNANDAEPELKATGLPVISDILPGYLGPLAGLHACMDFARHKTPSDTWIATFASDAPFVPCDLVAKLMEAVSNDVDAVVATSAGQTHPLSGLWRLDCVDQLKNIMMNDEIRAMRHWIGQIRTAEVSFSESPFDPFFNINDRQDLLEGERLAKAYNL